MTFVENLVVRIQFESFWIKIGHRRLVCKSDATHFEMRKFNVPVPNAVYIFQQNRLQLPRFTSSKHFLVYLYRHKVIAILIRIKLILKIAKMQMNYLDI